MKANEYLVLIDCVERGVAVGWNRAYKHDEAPSEHRIQDAIQDAVISEICEYFSFDDAPTEP